MPRKLKAHEKCIVAELINKLSKHSYLLDDLDNYLVKELDDGGMGSLLFVSDKKNRRFGAEIAEKKYTDIDGTPITISLNIDNHGSLFELDVWKVDFSPTIAIQLK